MVMLDVSFQQFVLTDVFALRVTSIVLILFLIFERLQPRSS